MLVVTSASMSAMGPWWSAYAQKHALYAGAALALVLVGAALPVQDALTERPKLVMSLAAGATLVALAACALALVIGREVNGARRWLVVGPVQLQPSELAKWSVVAFYAALCAYRPLDLDKFARGFLPALLPLALACGLVVKEDFGTAALIGAVGFALLLAGGAKLWHLLVTLPPALAAGAFAVLSTPYRVRRMTGFLDPWADPRGDGYHMVQSLLSFAHGGLTGRGLGAGVQKLGYLPEDTTDFVFAVIAEELGLAGAALVAALFAALILATWLAVRDEKVPAAGRLFALGAGLMVGLQATANMAVATVSVPTKGVGLPLVSYGGTALLLTAATLGLAAAAGRPAREREAVAEEEIEEEVVPAPRVVRRPIPPRAAAA